ncbi:PDR/VanB family oxidoreductase [Mycolicibacterium sp.]|uniref:PDR/VanB family oxidoreductase n=1 Tax=Mycolicibacterium sp. TaxID=2320850 RepID=UPI0037C634C7
MNSRVADADTLDNVALRVVRRERAAEAVVTLYLAAPDGEDLPIWEPGAHIALTVPGSHARQYSLCGDPADRTNYRISVLREDPGLGSQWIHDELREGDQVAVSGPHNHFELVPADRYVFIAGGIGITPIMAMIRSAIDSGTPWTLHYGGRSRTTMAHVEEIEAWGGNSNFIPEDEAGLIDLAAVIGSPQTGTLVYCCGPDALISAVEDLMGAWPDNALHVERFAPSAAADFSRDTEFSVRCEESDVTVRVERGVSIIEALAAAGIEISTSCGEGTCGTCETEVIEGIPDHRDSVLTESERKANESMMPCCSRSFSDLLVLNI